MTIRFGVILLVLAGLTGTQTGCNGKVAPGKKTSGNRFAIAYPNATDSAAIYKGIADALAAKLVQKQFVRVPTLDSQCCKIQVELLDFSASAEILSARVTVMDVDNQNLYFKVYRVEGKAGQLTAPDRMSETAGKLASEILADRDFMHSLAGT